MNLIETIGAAWGWCGMDAVEVVLENDFGNLLIRDCRDCYWRLCPEELACTVVARNRSELDVLCHEQEFLHDWYMRVLTDMAFEKLGALEEGRKYCLKIPAVLGGQYAAENMGSIGLVELVSASGDIARQIKDLPNGAKVRLKVTD